MHDKKLSEKFIDISESIATYNNNKKYNDIVHSITIDTKLQRLKIHFRDKRTKIYKVSTAKNGIGNQKNSFCTPSGWHQIYQKIGEKKPIGTVFRGRIAQKTIASIYTEKPIIYDKKNNCSAKIDIITTRVLWLDGLENGVNKGGNVDSKNRYIYIHGTNEEYLLGQAVSCGCIRMANKDILALFSLTSIGTRVLIV